MGLDNLEFTRNLWVEELAADPKKTTITQGKINRLNKYIDRIYVAYSAARRIEEKAEEFIEGVE